LSWTETQTSPRSIGRPSKQGAALHSYSFRGFRIVRCTARQLIDVRHDPFLSYRSRHHSSRRHCQYVTHLLWLALLRRILPSPDGGSASHRGVARRFRTESLIIRHISASRRNRQDAEIAKLAKQHFGGGASFRGRQNKKAPGALGGLGVLAVQGEGPMGWPDVMDDETESTRPPRALRCLRLHRRAKSRSDAVVLTSPFGSLAT
jgi:hypothetical protein